mgnify:CR=1 FL=1
MPMSPTTSSLNEDVVPPMLTLFTMSAKYTTPPDEFQGMLPIVAAVWLYAHGAYEAL